MGLQAVEWLFGEMEFSALQHFLWGLQLALQQASFVLLQQAHPASCQDSQCTFLLSEVFHGLHNLSIPQCFLKPEFFR